MKKYYIVLNVPDDFVPEEMGMEVTYPTDITIDKEGFGDYQSEIADIISNVELKKETITDKDIIVFKFPKEVLDNADAAEVLSLFKDNIEKSFGCPAVGYVNDVDILVENADQAIDMFNSMIAKIKVRSATGVSSKIILPN